MELVNRVTGGGKPEHDYRNLEGGDDGEALLPGEASAITAIKDGLSRLMSPTSGPRGNWNISLRLLQEKRRFGGFRPVQVALNGNMLTLSKGSNGKQFASYPVCFASKDEFTITEKERMQANKISTTMCGYKVTVFTPKRLYIFTSETEAELNNFDNTLRQMLHDVLDEHAYGLREQAAKQLVPQLDFKYAEDLKRAEMIHGVLAGFGLAENLPAIRKRGHLDLQSQLNPGFWKRQFFTLRKDVLYYSLDRSEARAMQLDPAALRKGLVPLKLATISQEVNEAQKHCGFVITTPYMTYHCKAKHEVDMLEWIAALENRRAPTPQTAAADDGANVRYTKPRLDYTDARGTRRQYKIDKPKVVIGRSKACDIVMKDFDSVSREHCRIEWNKQNCVITDSGSTYGCRVNDQRVARKVLRPGDHINLGKGAVLYFQCD
jgi:hypothetical protein